MPSRNASSLFERLTAADIEELLRPVPAPSLDRRPPIIQLERCPVCPAWLAHGDRARRRCRSCGVFLPA